MAELTAGDDPIGPLPGVVDNTADPIQAGSVRVRVRESMGIDLGPWTVDPEGHPDVRVRQLDEARAVIDAAWTTDLGAIPVVLGNVEPASRSGARRREVVVGGWRILLDVEPEASARLRDRARRGRGDVAHTGPLEVRAIIPGRVVAVSVAEGDLVEAGQQLLVVEAMKMQNELRSPRAGTVERIAVGVGQTVDLAALLLVLR